MRTGPWHIALSIALTACSRDAGVVVHAPDELVDRAGTPRVVGVGGGDWQPTEDWNDYTTNRGPQ